MACLLMIWSLSNGNINCKCNLPLFWDDDQLRCLLCGYEAFPDDELLEELAQYTDQITGEERKRAGKL